MDLVFTDVQGVNLHNHDRVRRAFYEALDAAGARQVVLYARRYTMATLILALCEGPQARRHATRPLE